MTEKQKPSKAPSTWRGKPHLAPGMEHHGEMQPVRYPDSLGRKVGGWLAGLLTIWKR